MNIIKKWYYKTRDSSRLLQTILCPFTILTTEKDLKRLYNKKDSFIGRTMFLSDHESKTFSEDYIFIRVEKKEVAKNHSNLLSTAKQPSDIHCLTREYKFIFMNNNGTLISRVCISTTNAEEIGNAFTIMWID